ncbi:MAG: FHA domain-containing protein [Phototrophicaceae bacterium]
MVQADFSNTEMNINTNVETRQLGVINSDYLRFDSAIGHEALKGPGIVLYLPDDARPIELWNIAVVSLGRTDRYSTVQPSIDLSKHHASLLGVSRIHAEIFYRDGKYYVRDLNSTNGTWVNNIKLVHGEEAELLNGDSLRLGHLMIQIGGY